MGSVSPVAASVTLPCTTCATTLPVSRRQSRENKKSLCLNTCPNDFISDCKVTNNPRLMLSPQPNITTMQPYGTAKGKRVRILPEISRQAEITHKACILPSSAETLKPNVLYIPSERMKTGSSISRLTGYHM